MSPLAFKILCVSVLALVVAAMLWDVVCEAATLCGLRREARIF